MYTHNYNFVWTTFSIAFPLSNIGNLYETSIVNTRPSYIVILSLDNLKLRITFS